MRTLLTVAEVAGRLRVTPATVQGWIRSGKLMAASTGRAYLICEGDLAEFLEAGKSRKGRK